MNLRIDFIITVVIFDMGDNIEQCFAKDGK
jgi:hypothetical protein